MADKELHEARSTYASFISMTKVGSVLVALTAILVIVIIS